MNPFIIQDKNGVYYHVLDRIGEEYLIANKKTNELVKISIRTMTEEYCFMRTD